MAEDLQILLAADLNQLVLLPVEELPGFCSMVATFVTNPQQGDFDATLSDYAKLKPK
jgi:hypothetical protein